MPDFNSILADLAAIVNRYSIPPKPPQISAYFEAISMDLTTFLHHYDHFPPAKELANAVYHLLQYNVKPQQKNGGDTP